MLLVALLMVGQLQADDIEINGVSYELNSDGTLRVVEHWPYYSGEVTIPSSVKVDGVTRKVTAIAPRAFANSADLTAVNLPSTITSIGFEAFANCTSLASFTFPNSLTDLGIRTLVGCSSLTTVNFGTAITSIPYGTCMNCYSLTQAVIPDQVTTVCGYAFANSYIDGVSFGQNISTIEPYAFDNCTRMRRVEVSNLAGWCRIKFDEYSYNPLNLARQLVVNGESVRYLKIPEGVNEMLPYTFTNMRVDSVQIPHSITKCDMMSFYKSELRTMRIPDWVTEVYAPLGLSLQNLTTVSIGKGVKVIEPATFSGTTKLTKLTLSEGLEEIRATAFANTAVTDLVIPNSVRVIDQAFGFARIKKLTIGSGLREIKDYAFHNDSALVEIHVAVPNPALIEFTGPGPFAQLVTSKPNVDKTKCVLYVPRGSVELYRNYPVWGEFTHIEEDNSLAIPGDANGNGSVDIEDVNLLINALLNKPTGDSFNPTAADANGDGSIDIDDVNIVINIMLGKG